MKTIKVALILLAAIFAGCGGGGGTGSNTGSSSGGPTPPSPAPRPTPTPTPTPAPAPPTTPPAPAPVYQNLSDAAAALRPGEWYQLPAKNKLTDVLITRAELEAPPYSLSSSMAHYFFGEGAFTLVTAWGGGTVGNGKFYVWGGGHSNYGGNEVYSFDLGTWTWTRLNNPSLYTAMPCGYAMPNGRCQTVDGTPVSVHSYQGIEYIPTTGSLWVGGGADFSSNGGFTDQSALFNPANTTWFTLPKMPWAGAGLAAWDPVSEKLLVAAGTGGGQLMTFNPATNTFENISSRNWSVGGTGAFDPNKRLLVAEADSRPNSVYVYNLAGIDLRNSTAPIDPSRFDYQTTYLGGVPFIPSFKASPGIVYDPDKKVFVVWDGGSDVWTLDPDTWNWTKASNVNAGPTQNSVSYGVYSRWRYLPDYGVYFGYDNPNENPWIYKLP